MKKLKRIICIVLVLSCLCIQGCSWEEMAERAKERRVSIAKKYIQEHKQIADSFVSEAPEYTFVMKLKSEFIDNDDAISKGYIKVESGEFLKDGNNPSNYSIYSVNVNPIYKNEDMVGREFSLWNKIMEERKIITIDITDEKSHFAFFSLRKAYNFLYDGKIFLVTYTDEPEMLSSFHYNKKSKPPAIYLMDFDNGRLIYVGYFVEYFDYVEKHNYTFYETYDFKMKMTTKDGIN